VLNSEQKNKKRDHINSAPLGKRESALMTALAASDITVLVKSC
jgi:hypothetical protein